MISVIYFTNNTKGEAKALSNQSMKDVEVFMVEPEDIEGRNRALKEAKGEFITFVSGKDELDENHLAYLIEGIAGAHLSVSGYNITDGGEVVYETPEGSKRLMTGEEMQCRVYYQYHYQGYIQNKLFRRQIIQSKHLSFALDLEENQDFLFLMQYLRYAKLVRMMPDHTYHFRPYQGLKQKTKSEALSRISETDGYLRCLKELQKRSDAMWLGEQTAAGSALLAYEAMEEEAFRKKDEFLFAKNPMKKMAKKCLKLDYDIEDDEEEALFLGLLEYSKTGRVNVNLDEEVN
ncbi:MAG: glycosyltransferase family 2 protein [Lachnospiraceae bacterium]|nr:glycosyltransferase family 2 protein [Lachnospiraceae bacterium]